MKLLIFKSAGTYFANPLENVVKIDRGEAPPLVSPLNSEHPERIILKDGRKFCVDKVVEIIDVEADEIKPVPKLLAKFAPYLKGIYIFKNSVVLLI